MLAIVENYLTTAETQFGFQMGILEGMSDEQLLWQAKPDIPPMLWHFSHCWYAESAAFRTFIDGNNDWAPQDWPEIFMLGGDIKETLPRLPKKDDAMAMVARLREELKGVLAGVKSESLEIEFPHWNLAPEGLPDFLSTPKGALLTMPVHTGHHQGEMMMLRRLQGGPKLV